MSLLASNLWGLASSALLLLLGGGLIGRWWTYRIANRKIDGESAREKREQARFDFEILMSAVTKQRDDAYLVIQRFETKLEHLEFELEGLRIARDLDPFPNWIVDLEGRYIFVNREFEKAFLEPTGQTYRDLIGKRHQDLWPPNFCKTLKQLDKVARDNPSGTARAKVAVNDQQLTVHKFPYRLKGVPVAVAGYITNIEQLAE